MLQETIGEGGGGISNLENLLGGWEFIYLDYKGRFGGLILGWKLRLLNFTNSWSFE